MSLVNVLCKLLLLALDYRPTISIECVRVHTPARTRTHTVSAGFIIDVCHVDAATALPYRTRRQHLEQRRRRAISYAL